MRSRRAVASALVLTILSPLLAIFAGAGPASADTYGTGVRINWSEGWYNDISSCYADAFYTAGDYVQVTVPQVGCSDGAGGFAVDESASTISISFQGVGDSGACTYETGSFSMTRGAASAISTGTGCKVTQACLSGHIVRHGMPDGDMGPDCVTVDLGVLPGIAQAQKGTCPGVSVVTNPGVTALQQESYFTTRFETASVQLKVTDGASRYFRLQPVFRLVGPTDPWGAGQQANTYGLLPHGVGDPYAGDLYRGSAWATSTQVAAGASATITTKYGIDSYTPSGKTFTREYQLMGLELWASTGTGVPDNQLLQTPQGPTWDSSHLLGVSGAYSPSICTLWFSSTVIAASGTGVTADATTPSWGLSDDGTGAGTGGSTGSTTPPATTPPPTPDAGCNFSIGDPTTWAAGGMCAVVGLIGRAVSILGSIASGVAGLAAEIASGLLDMLKTALVPDVASWGWSGFVDQVQARPPSSVVVGVASSMSTVASGFQGAGSCGVLADFGDGMKITCSAIRALPGYSGLYALVQVGLVGLTAFGVFHILRSAISGGDGS